MFNLFSVTSVIPGEYRVSMTFVFDNYETVTASSHALSHINKPHSEV